MSSPVHALRAVVAPSMSADAKARGRDQLLDVARAATAIDVALADRFAALFARERVIDAHRRELDDRERDLLVRRGACAAAEGALADRWQALVLRAHLVEQAERVLAAEQESGGVTAKEQPPT